VKRFPSLFSRRHDSCRRAEPCTGKRSPAISCPARQTFHINATRRLPTDRQRLPAVATPLSMNCGIHLDSSLILCCISAMLLLLQSLSAISKQWISVHIAQNVHGDLLSIKIFKKHAIQGQKQFITTHCFSPKHLHIFWSILLNFPNGHFTVQTFWCSQSKWSRCKPHGPITGLAASVSAVNKIPSKFRSRFYIWTSV